MAITFDKNVAPLDQYLRQAHTEGHELVICFNDRLRDQALSLTPEQCDDYRGPEGVNVSQLMTEFALIYPASNVITVKHAFDVRDEVPRALPVNDVWFGRGSAATVA